MALSLGEWMAIANHWAALHSSDSSIEPPSIAEFEAWQGASLH